MAATSAELRNVFMDATMRNRAAVATIVVAQAHLASLTITGNETGLAKDQIVWCQRALASPEQHADSAWRYLLAANKDVDLAVIQNVDLAQMVPALTAALPRLAFGAASTGV